MRITQNSLAANSLANLQASLARGAALQEELSTGKRINQPSDDPAGTVTSLALQNEIDRNNQYSRNADNGLGWLSTTDSTLTSVNDQLSRVRDLLVQASSTGNTDADGRAAIATEIGQIRSSVLQLANTTYLGRPIFGGTTAGGTAFAAGTTSSVGGQPDVSYVGDTGTVQRRVADGSTVRVDTDGQAAFGSGSSSVFSVLANVIDHLQNDPSALSGDLDAIDAASSNVRTALTSEGVRYSQLQDSQTTVTNKVDNLSTQLTSVQDVDMPSAIVALQTQQNAYQAALSSTAKNIQPSLLDFLQ